MEELQRDSLLRVGVITSTHGLRGEVKVFPTTDDPQRFRDLKTVILDAGSDLITLKIKSVRFFKNMVIVGFQGFDDISRVERFRNCDLLIRRDQAVKLEPNENFIVDLIGLKVITDEGVEFGMLKDVMQTGANDVYVIDGPDGREYLFPAIPECILKVDLERGEITVHIMDGLLDL